MESSFPKLPRFGISFIDPTPFKKANPMAILLYIYICLYIAIYIYMFIYCYIYIYYNPTTGKFWSIFHFYRIISLKKHGILQKNRVLIPKITKNHENHGARGMFLQCPGSFRLRRGHGRRPERHHSHLSAATGWRVGAGLPGEWSDPGGVGGQFGHETGLGGIQLCS